MNGRNSYTMAIMTAVGVYMIEIGSGMRCSASRLRFSSPSVRSRIIQA